MVLNIVYEKKSVTRQLPEIGSYNTFDIIVNDLNLQKPIAILPDVSLDETIVDQMIERFNKYQLDPCHLLEAVVDMLP